MYFPNLDGHGMDWFVPDHSKEVVYEIVVLTQPIDRRMVTQLLWKQAFDLSVDGYFA